MPSRPIFLALAAAAILGAALGVAAGWAYWGRAAAAQADRLASLESAATQIQVERERLRHELDDIVRERREMAATAEHLRSQVDQQLRRLEALAAELEPPAAEGASPPTATP
ncbi:MAG TPA: hypothetical protein VFD84_03880 [Candidatus Binatia bacterium]|nr:hypothetical protein [Candidatus Binatia bacterium]